MTGTESIIDFENHLDKCRVCLKDFDMEDTQVKITAAVQQRFEELTALSVSQTSRNLASTVNSIVSAEIN